jgi:hypothetical protein
MLFKAAVLYCSAVFLHMSLVCPHSLPSQTSLYPQAAPYYPAQYGNFDCVADAAYTQLQIDPLHHVVVAPQPTPQQLRQMELEAEQRALEARIAAERAQLDEERAAQYAQLQAERMALREQQRLNRSNSLKTVPSTDFTPVSARKKTSTALTPEYTTEESIPGLAHEDTSQEDIGHDSLVSDPGAHQERYDDARYQQEQELLQLQQQKEFRDLQHQQQKLHQRHQQQLLQQQTQHQERLRQEELQTQQLARREMDTAGYTPSEALYDLDMSAIHAQQWNNAAVGGIRESVEMSPMSPPIFQYLLEPSAPGYALPTEDIQDITQFLDTAEAPEEYPADSGKGEDYYSEGEFEAEAEYNPEQEVQGATTAQDVPSDDKGGNVGSERTPGSTPGEATARSELSSKDNHTAPQAVPDSARSFSDHSQHSTCSADMVNQPSRKVATAPRFNQKSKGVQDSDSQVLATGAALQYQDIDDRAQSPHAVPQLSVQCDSPDSAFASSAKQHAPRGLAPAAQPSTAFPQARSPPARKQSRAREGFPVDAAPAASAEVLETVGDRAGCTPVEDTYSSKKGAADVPVELESEKPLADEPCNAASVGVSEHSIPLARTPHAQRQQPPEERFTGVSQKVHGEDV